MLKLRRLELRPAEMPSICCHLVIQKEKLVCTYRFDKSSLKEGFGYHKTSH